MCPDHTPVVTRHHLVMIHLTRLFSCGWVHPSTTEGTGIMPWWGTLLSALGLGGALLGGAVKMLAGLDHDWQTCSCEKCKAKLYRARKKRGDRVIGTDDRGNLIWTEPPATSFNWLSTNDLSPKMTVEVGGEGYIVVRLYGGEGTVRVTLLNIRTRRRVVVLVKQSNADRKFWKPGYGS